MTNYRVPSTPSYWQKWLADIVGVAFGLVTLFLVGKWLGWIGLFDIETGTSSSKDPTYLLVAPFISLSGWLLIRRFAPRETARVAKHWAFWLPPACGHYLLNAMAFFRPEDRAPLWSVVAVSGVCVLIVLFQTVHQFQRIEENSRSADEVLGQTESKSSAIPGRKPILLLLRSFTDDAKPLEQNTAPLTIGGNPIFDDMSLDDWLAEEAEAQGFAIYRVGNRASPKLDGDGGRTLDPAESGGSEIPTIQEPGDWTATVKDLLDRAEMVVLIPGATEGVKMEICELVKRDLLFERCLLILPPETPEENRNRWQDFSALVDEQHGISLPNLPASGRAVAVRLRKGRDADWVTVSGDLGVESYRCAVEILGLAPSPSRAVVEPKVLESAPADETQALTRFSDPHFELILRRYWLAHTRLLGRGTVARLVATRETSPSSLTFPDPSFPDPSDLDGRCETEQILSGVLAVLQRVAEQISTAEAEGAPTSIDLSTMTAGYDLPEVAIRRLERAVADLVEGR